MDDLGAEQHSDKPYDEAIEVSGDDASTPTSSPRQKPLYDVPSHASPSPKGKPEPLETAVKASSPGTKSTPKSSPGKSSPGKSASPKPAKSPGKESSSSDATSTSSSDDDEGMIAGQYNPADYANLKVSPEVSELFQYITRYKPHAIELDTKLKAFIPDFIPAIGEVDAMIKIPRPDNKPDGLGLTRVDEPCLNPADPAVLELQLRSISKHQNLTPIEVRSVRTDAEIKQWVNRIGDLHRSKPATAVQYSKKMPDIETLMQVWPAEMESYLEQNLPSLQLAALDHKSLSLKDYIKIICVLLDIPVHDGSLTDSLHVLFSLYSEFKNNQHFGQQLGALSPETVGGRPLSAGGSGGLPSGGRAGTPV
ncbi:unnamed protein product [Amoebophrya sp. A120]|nr:unnamed protein product [Amoebophrya sp. A120]|eukprot:GSA120T00014875001.1